MKKLFMASIALLLLSLSILIFQLSCKKEAQAQGTNTPNVIAFVSWGGSSGTLCIVNADGSNRKSLNRCATHVYGIINNRIIYVAACSGAGSLYSCNLDGSDPKEIAQGNIAF